MGPVPGLWNKAEKSSKTFLHYQDWEKCKAEFSGQFPAKPVSVTGGLQDSPLGNICPWQDRLIHSDFQQIGIFNGT